MCPAVKEFFPHILFCRYALYDGGVEVEQSQFRAYAVVEVHVQRELLPRKDCREITGEFRVAVAAVGHDERNDFAELLVDQKVTAVVVVVEHRNTGVRVQTEVFV